MNNNELFFRNISRKWISEAKKANAICFLSPYITSRMAESVLFSSFDGCDVDIFTVFKAENFMTKASSLSTLKKLLLKGYNLYHIDGLHAKVMISDNFLSIGSQNLTTQGRKNLEATVAINEKKAIEKAKLALEQWKENAIPISLQMIDEMQVLLMPFFAKFEELQTTCMSFDKLILPKTRLISNVKIRSSEYMKFISEMNSNLEGKKINQSPTYYKFAYNFDKELLVPYFRKSIGFLRWNLADGQNFQLNKNYRYALVDTKTGKITWARLAKTRISFFEKSLRKTSSIWFSEECTFTYTTVANPIEEGFNLRVEIYFISFNFSLHFKCRFGFSDSFQFEEDLKGKYIGENRKTRELIYSKVESSPINLEQILIHEMCTPFKYDKRLTGGDSSSFFGRTYSYGTMNLVKLQGAYFLTCTKES